MSFLDRLRRRPAVAQKRGGGAAGQSEGGAQGASGGGGISQRDVLGSLIELGGFPLFGDGKRLTRSRAVEFSALFRCVTILSFWLAVLVAQRLRVVDSDGNRIKGSKHDNIIGLLTYTPDNGTTAAFRFLQNWFVDLLLDGNGIVLIDRDLSGNPRNLDLCIAEAARAYRTSRQSGRRRMYELQLRDHDDQGEDLGMIDATDVMHLAWPRLDDDGFASSSNGRRLPFGTSPLKALRNAIGIGIDADLWVRDYFDRDGGSRADYAVTFDENPPGPEMEAQIVEAIDRNVSSRGGTRQRKPALIWKGGKITELSKSPSDADSQRLREFQVRETGRVYGVPPPILGETMSAWGKGIEQLARHFYSHGVKPLLDPSLAEMSFRLLPRGASFDVDEIELLRGNFKDVADAAMKLLGNQQTPGAITINEIRSYLKLAREPDGELYQPPAMMPKVPKPSARKEAQNGQAN